MNFISQQLAAEEFKVGFKVKVTNKNRCYPNYKDMAEHMGLLEEWDNTSVGWNVKDGDLGVIVATSKHLDSLDQGFCVMVKFNGGYQIMSSGGIEIDYHAMTGCKVLKKLEGCARCGETHEGQLVFKKLTIPIASDSYEVGLDWTHKPVRIGTIVFVIFASVIGLVEVFGEILDEIVRTFI